MVGLQAFLRFFLYTTNTIHDIILNGLTWEIGLWLMIQSTTFKGTVSRDFLLLVFLMNQFPPQPRSIALGPFRIFSKIRGDNCKSRCTTGINDTGGKFATGINNAGGKFATGVIDIMGTISGCSYLKLNLKAKIYIYVNSTTQRCPN